MREMRAVGTRRAVVHRDLAITKYGAILQIEGTSVWRCRT